MASILLPVPQILQNPELPNGCEITSCCEVLHYLALPRISANWPTTICRAAPVVRRRPRRGLYGNPHLDDGSPETGYYCFAGPIVQAATLPGCAGQQLPRL